MSAKLFGGLGPWIDHATAENQRDIDALTERVAHLEGRIDQLEAKLADATEALDRVDGVA